MFLTITFNKATMICLVYCSSNHVNWNGGPDYRVVPWKSSNGTVETDILLIYCGEDERSRFRTLVP